MRRRDFLRAAVAVALVVPSLAGGCRRQRREGFFSGLELERGDLTVFTEIYFARFPEARDADALERELLGERSGSGPGQLKRDLAERIRQDFAEGNTVVLDGWVLSSTEVRLWCLYALTGD